jgi:hypothetical protein
LLDGFIGYCLFRGYGVICCLDAQEGNGYLGDALGTAAAGIVGVHIRPVCIEQGGVTATVRAVRMRQLGQ